MTRPHLFIFSGEQSGDLHGGHLLDNLKKMIPKLLATGVGGPLLRQKGLECILRAEDFEVMGFSDVLKSLPKLLKQFHRVRSYILAAKPDLVVLIDYPGFNLRLAQDLRKYGYKGKIVQYISPTVWAHGRNRINILAENCDLLMTIFPFEAQYYAHTHLKVAYVGNPIQEYISKYQYKEDWKEQAGIPHGMPLISLFPGSRKGEVKKNLPVMMQAIKEIRNELPGVAFAVSCAHAETRSQALKIQNLFLVEKNFAYEMMRDSCAAVAKSGTVTLELALHGCPTVVAYRLSPLNRFFARYLLRLNMPHYCIVNIICGKKVFPEFIENGFSANNISLALKNLVLDTPERKLCIDGCRETHGLLNMYNASEKAAALIYELLS